MIVHLQIEPAHCRKWLNHLICVLSRQAGVDLRLDVADVSSVSKTSLEALLSLEKRLIRRGKACGSDPCFPDSLPIGRATGEKPDLVIDLTGSEGSMQGKDQVHRLRPRFNGALGEEALAAFLLESGSPVITLEEFVPHEDNNPIIIASAVASLEAAQGLGGGLEAVYSRVTNLLARALKGVRDDEPPSRMSHVSPISQKQVAKHVAKNLVSSLVREIYNLCCYPSHWRIGWRHIDGSGGVLENRSLGGKPWTVLSHPVDHFYADPFVMQWKGRDYLFFEDLDHRIGKGVISVVIFDEHGMPGATQVVLEEAWHLSYPFLLEWEGEIWMIPESSLNNDIAIYRAVDFPLRWERHDTLLSGLEAADATLVEHNGAWWMFTVEREGIGGYSDTLYLYKADSPFGPWAAHPKNPVLIDHKTARPAGQMIADNGRLWRPVQDCTGGYGAALGLAEVIQLDDDDFAQRLDVVIHPESPQWPGRKLHTLNRSGNLEVIDGCIYRPRVKSLATITDRYYKPG